MSKPNLLVSADWSTNEKKRWMVRAELRDSHYVIYPPEPVGDVKTLIARLLANVDENATVLVGFDFPIGLPHSYAKKAEISSFREALKKCGSEDWRRFYEISDNPSLKQPFAPLPKRKGEKGFNRNRIADALGFKDYKSLLRRCDHKTSQRNEAEIVFFTLGGKQVGAGACLGWRDVIAPNPTIKLWPFDGNLEDLLSKPGLTVCETYPGEAYHHIGIRIGSGTGKSKTKREDRQEFCKTILRNANKSCIFTNAAVSWIEYGFLEEDDFDAMVALLSMIQVVTGVRKTGVPQDEIQSRIEGWILGLQSDSSNASWSTTDPPKADHAAEDSDKNEIES
jgi:hypothetical protein